MKLDLIGKDISLVVTLDRAEKRSRCFTVTHWTVYSSRPLTDELLKLLIPHGQEFTITHHSYVTPGIHTYSIHEATDSGD